MVHNLLPEGANALAINSGTVFHTHHKPPVVKYLDEEYVPKYVANAYVNKRDWRKLTEEELLGLAPDETRNDYNTLYLGEIPTALKECFKALKLHESADREEVYIRFQSNQELTQKATQLLHEFLLPLANNKKFNFHCIGTNYPNIELVACNTTMLEEGYKQSEKTCLGMHNDGTQLMTIDTAHEFGNRISINLGKDSRYFLFVNLQLKEAHRMLEEKLSADEFQQINISNIPQYFFKNFPDYPVMRVEQKPYQYYISSTDNCFHDGSTLGATHLDVCIVYFGNFQY